MNTRRALVSILLTALAASIAIASFSVMQIKPPANEPKIINPGPPGGPPSDAIVLFDGKDLSQWRSARPARRRRQMAREGWLYAGRCRYRRHCYETDL